MQLDYEQLNKIFNDAFREMAESAERAFGDIYKKVIKEIDLAKIERNHRRKYQSQFWVVPQSTAKNHQVLDRKPLVSHIRNNI